MTSARRRTRDEARRGDWLGRYRVVTRLGRGGMATVYLAASLGPDDFCKLVVIKELMPELSDDPGFVRMFRNEARLAARLQHPNVVQTYDAWQLGPQQFLTMEFLDGQPLHRALARLGHGALGLPVRLYVLRCVLAALHYAHELCDFDGTPLNLVHRDVSPHNVFVTYDGQVKLVDFGIAKAGGSAPTEVGTFKGKTNYAAPEQILGGEVDRRADLFAAGVMLWEALAGRPIHEPGRDQANALFERLQGREPGVLDVNPQADPALAAICARAMALEPADRFADAHAFREALEAHPLGAPSPALAAELGAQLAAAFAAERDEVQGSIEAVLRQPTLPPPDRDTEPTPLEAWPSSQPSAAGKARAGRLSLAGRARWAAGALFVVGLGAALIRGSSRSETRRAGEAGGAAEAASGTAGGAAEMITIAIGATPAHASIFVDGAHVRGNPVRYSAPRDGLPHRVRAEAEGFVAEERVLSLEAGHDVSLRLEPVPHGGPRDKPTEPTPAPGKRRGKGRDIDDDPYGP